MSGPGRVRAAVVLLTIGLCTTATPSLAEAEDQLVYWPLVTDGAEYRRISYPREAGPLLVLADTEVAIEARRAPVSYWPLTREYLADFSRGEKLPEVDLEIVDPAGAVTVIEPSSYVMWHPDGVGLGPAKLVRGEASATLYEDYVRTARASAEQAKEHQRLVAEQRALMEGWLRMAAERGGKNLPDPPPDLIVPAPKPYRAYASEPQEALVVSLPQGRYTVRLRGADGETVPGSERDLISFAPVDEGVGYVLRPENRWTQPVVSFAPDEVIYTTGETDLFFQPVPVVEYRAQHFTRLFSPQSVESVDPSLTVWVPRAEAAGAGQDRSLALWSRGDLIESLSATGYRVVPTPGVSRGYGIEAFTPQDAASLEPDFTAMRMEQASGVTAVSLAENADAGQVDDSERQVRFVSPPAEWMLFLPALLPLALGIALRTISAKTGRRVV